MKPGVPYLSSKCLPSAWAIVIAAWLTCPDISWAYLDPGAGSFAFQMLIAAGMATLFAIKMYWTRIKDFFRRRTGATADRVNTPASDPNPGGPDRKPDSPAHFARPNKEES